MIKSIFALCLFLLSACSLFNPRVSETASNYAKWMSNRPPNYAYTYFSGGMAWNRYAVVVKNYLVLEVQLIGGSFGTNQIVSNAEYPVFSIESNFRNVSNSYASGNSSIKTLSWDSYYGYPASVLYDPLPNAIDDETSVTITNFRITNF